MGKGTVNLIATILLASTIWSCGGTRQTETSKNETKNDRINIDNHYESGTKIVMANNYTFNPIDNSKPFFMNGHKYENVAIAVDKGITKGSYFKIKEKVFITKTITIEKNKTTDKTNYILLWLGMFFILVCAVWAWFYFRNYRSRI